MSGVCLNLPPLACRERERGDLRSAIHWARSPGLGERNNQECSGPWLSLSKKPSLLTPPPPPHFLFSLLSLLSPPLLSLSLSPSLSLQYQMKSFVKVVAFTKTILKNSTLPNTVTPSSRFHLPPNPPLPSPPSPSLHILPSPPPSPHLPSAPLPSTPSETPTVTE